MYKVKMYVCIYPLIETVYDSKVEAKNEVEDMMWGTEGKDVIYKIVECDEKGEEV